MRINICPLQHQDVSGAPLTAVKGDVLVAGVRVKPADALFVAEEIRGGRVAEQRLCLVFWRGNWIQNLQDLRQ